MDINRDELSVEELENLRIMESFIVGNDDCKSGFNILDTDEFNRKIRQYESKKIKRCVINIGYETKELVIED